MRCSLIPILVISFIELTIMTLQKYKRFLICQDFFFKKVAERKGFEPLERKSVQRFSRPPHSTTLASLLTFSTNKKQPPWVALSGDRGIRTPDTFLYNGFQDRRDRPLCHISAAKIQKFSMPQHFFEKFFNFLGKIHYLCSRLWSYFIDILFLYRC